MQDLPHRYTASASSETEGEVRLESPRLPMLSSAGPAEFGGPGDRWSPETLLVGAAADCLVLTFRAMARAAGLEWRSLDVDATGKLERVEHRTRFTEIHLRATLSLPAGGDVERAEKLLHRAEAGCLITNSMNAETHLEAVVRVEMARAA